MNVNKQHNPGQWRLTNNIKFFNTSSNNRLYNFNQVHCYMILLVLFGKDQNNFLVSCKVFSIII